MTCKIAFFDVDGTVTESAQPMKPVMAELLATSIQKLVFISGTDFCELRRMLEPLKDAGREFYILPEMGASAFSSMALMLYDSLPRFNSDLFHEIKAYASEAMDKIGLIPVAHDVFILRHSQMTISILGRSAPHQMKVDVDPSGSIRRKIICDIVKGLGETGVVNFTLGGTSSIDIQESPWDKRDGVTTFLDYMGVEPHEAIYFGDKLQPGGNDYPVTHIRDLRVVEVKDPLDTYTKLVKLRDGQ